MILQTKGTKCRCDGARQHLFYVAFNLQFLICYTPILKGAQRQEAARLAVPFDPLAALEVIPPAQEGCSSPWQESPLGHLVGQKERKQNVQQVERSDGNKSKGTLRAGKGGKKGLYKDLAQALHRGLCPSQALKTAPSRASPKDWYKH